MPHDDRPAKPFDVSALRRRGLRLAAAGLAAWGAGVVVLRPGLTAALVLLGPLVAVPMGLSLSVQRTSTSPAPGPWRLAQVLQLPAALLFLASFAWPPGALALACTLPWFAFTVLLAALGVVRFAERGRLDVVEMCLDAGLVLPVVGGLWAAHSRWGKPLMGFDEPYVLLTAAHFHFAGFALPILTALAGRTPQGEHGRSWLAAAAAAGVAAGVPLLALGITLGARGHRLVELAAACWLAAASVLTAVLELRLAARVRGIAASLALALSGVSLATAMGFAVVYACGLAFDRNWLDIPTMVACHATANVVGFALPALATWLCSQSGDIERRRDPHAAGGGACQVLLPALGDRARIDDWQERPFSVTPDDEAATGVAHASYSTSLGVEAAGEPEPDGPFRRAARAISRFEVFAADRFTAIVPRVPVMPGDTLGCSYRLFPGVRIALAARVVTCFEGEQDGLWRAGFTYRTVAGHPLGGEETFAVEKELESGRVRMTISSWSRPLSATARLARPLVRRLQRTAVAAALERQRREHASPAHAVS